MGDTKMSYKWKPSASQRKQFAENMKDETFKADYFARKKAREDKRRGGSRFNYNSAGGFYVPTKFQFDFCMSNADMFLTESEKEAVNQVIYGYSCSEKIHHDHIHIVNEKIRKTSIN